MIARAIKRPSAFTRVPMLALVTAVAILPAMAGCPGHLGADFPPASGDATSGGSGGADGSGGANGACDPIATIFVPTCGAGGCHSATDFLNLTGADADVAARLIGKPQMLSPACAGMNLVNATAPPDGVLFKLLTGTTCGAAMPLGAPALSTEQIGCIKAWLASKL